VGSTPTTSTKAFPFPITTISMNQQRKLLLESRGWKFGFISEFLALTPEEIALIDSRLNRAGGPHHPGPPLPEGEKGEKPGT
jgi:hypothetical protein